jgi:4-deoxy-L-threo-5-hexosulose-uronate ketol-isomerase
MPAGCSPTGEIRLVYTHYDRLILGGAVPDGQGADARPGQGMRHPVDPRPARDGHPQHRRERHRPLAGTDYTVNKGDVLYIGMGSGPVTFSGPGRFYILSAPAHRTCPTRLIPSRTPAGSNWARKETSNERVILQFLHPEVCRELPAADGLHAVRAGLGLEHHAGASA